jgi:dsDNA-binding SOS-regulon protein
MMEDWICRQNIQRWRGQLVTARDERQREVLIVLLAEEHEKLRRFTATGPRHSGHAEVPGVSS